MNEGVPGPLGRRDFVAVAALSLIGVGIPLWLAAAAGAIGLPTIDDWVYTRGADSLFRTGILSMPGHTAGAIGQLIMVQPLLWLSGGDGWAFTAFGLIMTLLGVVATYFLARRFVGVGCSIIAVLLVEAFPGFARESMSFLTDVPAYALTVVCLLLGSRWLDGKGRHLTLVTSLAVGLIAVSIREFAIAAPAAILVAAWFRTRSDERIWLASVTSVFAVTAASVLIVAALVPGRATPASNFFWLLRIGPVFVTFAVVVLPAVALGMPRRLATLRPLHLITGAGLACFAVVLPWGSRPGNSWESGFGSDQLLSGIRAPILGTGAWALSAQLALFAAILVAALAVRWGQRNLWHATSLSAAWSLLGRLARRRDGLLVLFLTAYAVELVAFSPFFIYDRYLYPIVPVAATLVLIGLVDHSRLGRSHAFGHAALVWLAVTAFLVNANSFAYDAARYRQGDIAVALGYDAQTVDSGYEWSGNHSIGPAQSGTPARDMFWNVDRWSLSNACAVLSNSPLSDNTLELILLDRSAYLQYLFFGPPQPLYLYGVVRSGCPRPPHVVS